MNAQVLAFPRPSLEKFVGCRFHHELSPFIVYIDCNPAIFGSLVTFFGPITVRNLPQSHGWCMATRPFPHYTIFCNIASNNKAVISGLHQCINLGRERAQRIVSKLAQMFIPCAQSCFVPFGNANFLRWAHLIQCPLHSAINVILLILKPKWRGFLSFVGIQCFYSVHTYQHAVTFREADLIDTAEWVVYLMWPDSVWMFRNWLWRLQILTSCYVTTTNVSQSIGGIQTFQEVQEESML